MRRHAALEAASGLFVLVLLAWLAVSGWRFYTSYLLPGARSIATATVSPVPDPGAAREEARRMRRVLDHVGAGISLRQANQRERAIQEFQAALALDPQNADARLNLVELGVLPAASPVPTPGQPPGPPPAPTSSVAPLARARA